MSRVGSPVFNVPTRQTGGGTPCHAIIAITHPHLFHRSSHPVAVELRGEHTRGMTVTDVRPPAAVAAELAPPAQDVVWDADAQAVIDLIVEAVINS